MDKQKLMDAGVNYEEGLKRFSGLAKMYEKYLRLMFTGDQSDYMDKLKALLVAKDYAGAFRIAHDLKGMSGNLSMDEFYKSICELVEELRGGVPQEDVMSKYEAAAELYRQVQQAVTEE